MNYFLLCFTVIVFIGSCSNRKGDSEETARQEIAQAEKEFEKMAEDKGMAEAFSFFADSNAVIKRQNDTLIKGKEGIRNYYSAGYFEKATVSWSPDFIEASPDGLFGYTYGNYIWRSKDSTGNITASKGIFHTVWKKQKDGSWKYTWD